MDTTRIFVTGHAIQRARTRIHPHIGYAGILKLIASGAPLRETGSRGDEQIVRLGPPQEHLVAVLAPERWANRRAGTVCRTIMPADELHAYRDGLPEAAREYLARETGLDIDPTDISGRRPRRR
jgi:hypothetical protein